VLSLVAGLVLMLSLVLWLWPWRIWELEPFL